MGIGGAATALHVGSEAAAADSPLPALDAAFGEARARSEGKFLLVTTGRIERRWLWTGKGLVTVSLRDLSTDTEWARSNPDAACDWAYQGVLDDSSDARVVSLVATKSDDEGFTSEHLAVTAEIEYPSRQMTLRYVIWAYPGAPGLRSQLWIKGRPADSARNTVSPGIVVQRGRAIRFAVADSKTPEWRRATLDNGLEMMVRFTGLKKDRKYLAGLTWWNPDDAERRQEVRLTSVDGEAKTVAVPARELPRLPADGEPEPEPVTFDVPDSVRKDGSATVFIRSLTAAHASMSELWLYESGPADGELQLSGAAERIETLRRHAPQGTHLAAYLSAASPPRNNPSAKTLFKRADYVPVDVIRLQPLRRYIGYYNDMQHRNTPETECLREEVRDGAAAARETAEWASIASLESPGRGLLMVKESHKCVNQAGVDTGAFLFDRSGLQNTGWALALEDLRPDSFQWCWASWVIAHDGTGDGRELALKQFDRIRYPVVLERDMYMLACTWGNSRSWRDGANYATEKQVLPEMNSVADLGIDMLLIDDGWETSLRAEGSVPDGGMGWKPNLEAYPQGWRNVIARRKKLGLRLGLWFDGGSAPLADVKWNWDQIHMDQVKLDFLSLARYPMLSEMADRVRQFIRYTGHRSMSSMDVTENAPRFGYYWGREYGAMHFMNRKPVDPPNVIYIPWLALRDFWQLSRYNNLAKWQLTTQNPEVVKPELSDAGQHSVSYCTATTFMGIPEFLLITRYYSEGARKELRDLLSRYKRNRKEIFAGMVFPVGEKPSNASWSGFQSYDPEKRTGHLLVFRERLNQDAARKLAIRFLPPGTKLAMEDVRTGAGTRVTVGEGRTIQLGIARPADFVFLRYSA